MRVALVHYWLVGMRGGEKVLESLCELYPTADVYTHVYSPDRLSPLLAGRQVRETFVGKLPFARRLYQAYLPLMPYALAELDLSEYDLVISSESGPAKGVLTRPDALHLCYCHTPMRYIWDQYHVYRSGMSALGKFGTALIAKPLREWDVASANMVDAFVANSSFVRSRIKKVYRRDSAVVYPPVDVERFAVSKKPPTEDFYLYVGQLVRYKRADLAVAVARKMNLRLLVVGEGPEMNALRATAGPTIQFLGRCSDEELTSLYQRARALLFPGEEDFGIVPLEATAAGCPVIALERGGALDTVKPGINGLFVEQPTTEQFCAVVEQHEATVGGFSYSGMLEHARGFSPDAFKQNILKAVADGWADL